MIYNLSQLNLGILFSQIASDNKNVAIKDINNNIYSFEELENFSNKIANFLIDNCFVKGDRIAIFNNKNFLCYSFMIAALKVGCVYSNLDRNVPKDRLISIFNQIKPKLLLAEDFNLNENIGRSFLNNSLVISDIKAFQKKIEIYSSKLPNEVFKVNSSNIAYIMFTSGSTGTPKGVTITHSNLINFINWAREEFQITSKDNFTNINQMHFDNSVFDFYCSLFNNASITSIKDELLKQPLALVKFISESKCTIWFSVPSLFVYGLKTRSFSKDYLSDIRIITFGGEGFPKASLRELSKYYFERIDFKNVYGPTECTCICSCYDVKQSDLNSDELLPLGLIADNFSFMIVNEDNKLVKNGEIGELLLGGNNVGKGYFGEKDRTSKVFIQNPMHEDYLDIYYKTGDLVRIDQETLLMHFCGRIDNQIKRMGYRIEIEEIEIALNSLPYVRESVIIPLMKREFNTLNAIISASQNDEIKLIKDLRNKVPSYMIPDKVYYYETIPKNNNGKIDRKGIKQIIEKCLEQN